MWFLHKYFTFYTRESGRRFAWEIDITSQTCVSLLIIFCWFAQVIVSSNLCILTFLRHLIRSWAAKNRFFLKRFFCSCFELPSKIDTIPFFRLFYRPKVKTPYFVTPDLRMLNPLIHGLFSDLYFKVLWEGATQIFLFFSAS